jgi:hypothetical protein
VYNVAETLQLFFLVICSFLALTAGVDRFGPIGGGAFF